MEKFYIIKNKQFLKEVKDYKKNGKVRDNLIQKFFKKHGITGSKYFIGGNGFVNEPFTEDEKENICLYVEDTKENLKKFEKQLKKPVTFKDGQSLYPFRKNSAILKEFQQECINKKIIINLHSHREGDYFKEVLYTNQSVTRFEYENQYYLRISADVNDITPIQDGFIEIKGSEFYNALERLKEEK